MSERRECFVGGGFALIVVLFILLVIIGTLFTDGSWC